MKERPIFFSAPMVRAILDGKKTQTRRIAKPLTLDTSLLCPYGQPGDRLWVRETWQAYHPNMDPETGNADDLSYAHRIPFENAGGWWSVAYAATDPDAHPCDRAFPWRPSIHMPRWASRITLAVESVRVERLHDITEADARAEGCTDGGCGNCGESSYPTPCGCSNPKPLHADAFAGLWMGINGVESWHANPWVWVIGFSRVRP